MFRSRSFLAIFELLTTVRGEHRMRLIKMQMYVLLLMLLYAGLFGAATTRASNRQRRFPTRLPPWNMLWRQLRPR
jgi:hypothetical protein